MKTRILSAVVALPLLLFIVISGGIWLHVGVGLLGLIGMYEFNRAIAGEVKGAHIIAYLFGLFYVVSWISLCIHKRCSACLPPYLCLLC